MGCCNQAGWYTGSRSPCNTWLYTPGSGPPKGSITSSNHRRSVPTFSSGMERTKSTTSWTRACCSGETPPVGGPPPRRKGLGLWGGVDCRPLGSGGWAPGCGGNDCGGGYACGCCGGADWAWGCGNCGADSAGVDDVGWPGVWAGPAISGREIRTNSGKAVGSCTTLRARDTLVYTAYAPPLEASSPNSTITENSHTGTRPEFISNTGSKGLRCRPGPPPAPANSRFPAPAPGFR